MRRYVSSLLLALAAMLAAACATTSGPAVADEPDEPLNIRLIHGIPTATIFAMMQPLAEEKPELFPGYGTDYTLEISRIDASSEVANVMAAGEADIGFTATGAFINANRNLGADLRIVADVVQYGVEGHNANWFVVLEDSEIEEIEDLSGKTVATLGFGTAIDLVMRVGLQRAGLDPERDMTVVQVPFPAMEANLREGKADMVQMVPPFFQIARSKGGVRVLFTAAEVFPEAQPLFLAARESFLEENPRRVQSFFDDYYRFLQYALDPDNREEMIAIGARMQELPPDGFLPWWNTKEDFYRDPEGLPNLDAINEEQEVLKQFGILDETVDLDPWTDLSFMRRAAENAGQD